MKRTNVETPIICLSCGTLGKVARVTEDLSCPNCKTGANLDIYDGQPKTAAPHGPGTGWNTTQPDALKGWDEYAGPQVGTNPLVNQKLDADADRPCPACGGTGHDNRASGGGYDENTCRLCGGSGRYTPPTSSEGPKPYDKVQGPASGGARIASQTPLHITLPDGTKWEGVGHVVQAGRTSTDPLGSVEQYNGEYNDNRDPAKKPAHPATGQIKIDAPCPNCRHSVTHITRDAKDDGWWTCPECGSLANIDKNPDVNPHAPEPGFTPDRGIKLKASRLGNKKTGQLFKMIVAIKETNSGLSSDEALTLSRKALLKLGHN